MSTQPKQPADSANRSLLALQTVNGYITLGVQAAGVVIPLVKALVSKIEGIGTGNVTISFTDLVAADSAELDAIVKLSTDDLAAVNAELVRMGLPPLPDAPPDAPAPAAPGIS